MTDEKTLLLSNTGELRSSRQRPMKASLRPPPYEAAVSRKPIPAATAASSSANASSSDSPCPQVAGSEPIPPKFPQPRPIRVSSIPVRPRRLVSTR